MIFGKHTKYVVGYRVFSSFFQNNSHVYIPVGRCAQNWRIESKSVFKILLMHIRSSSRKHSNTVYGISKKKKKEKTNKKKIKGGKKTKNKKQRKKHQQPAEQITLQNSCDFHQSIGKVASPWKTPKKKRYKRGEKQNWNKL